MNGRHGMLAVCIGLILASIASAEGWKLPNLNPFSSKEKEDGSEESETQSNWSFPALPKIPTPKMPTWGASKPARPSFARRQEPSTWERVTDAPKQMWDKTKNAFALGSASDSNSRSKASNRSSTGLFKKKNDAKKGMFSGLFPSDEDSKPKKIETVNDFLAQPTIPIE